MSDLYRKELNEIAALIDKRYERNGRDLKTVGWGNAETQRLRFDLLFKELDPTDRAILDVGCGLGDLIPYLNNTIGDGFRYVGIDTSEKVIKDAQQRHTGQHISFYHGAVHDIPLCDIDISVLSGALSYRFNDAKIYAESVVDKMFSISRIGASLNFLSTRCDYQLEKNQHYDPAEVLTWALARTNNVIVNHDYPLYEFTITLKK